MTWPPPQPWPDPDDQAYATAPFFAPWGGVWAPHQHYPAARCATVQYLGQRATGRTLQAWTV